MHPEDYKTYTVLRDFKDAGDVDHKAGELVVWDPARAEPEVERGNLAEKAA
jgi:hypothetical protein